MEQLWLLCVIIAVVVLLLVIFFPTPSKDTATYRVSKPKVVEKGVCGDLEGANGQRCLDREMLKSFYPPPLVEDTPVDYPKKAIGACPYSREMSKPLPLADIPMCLINSF